VGDPIVRRGLDVTFHSRDYPAHLLASQPAADAERLWLLGPSTPATAAEVLAASDLHVAPSRPYPVARSLLEAMAAGCVVMASDTAPHREMITPRQTGLLIDGDNVDAFTRQALSVLADRAAHRPLGDAAAELVRARYAQDVCLPRLAERFSALAAAQGKRL
jgi:glycosyltransferase involved in cell wall biosynthesis